MVTIQVFLNTSCAAAGFGFRNDLSESSVYLAARFELEDKYISKLSAGVPIAALEVVYSQLNDDPAKPWAKPWATQYAQAGHRSLSVGDVVVIGEVPYAVAAFGFQQITTDELLDAINLERINA